MKYDGGKNGNGVIHALARQIPPHRARVEAFGGSFPLLRLVKPALVNVGIDADRDAVAAAASNPALRASRIIQGDALAWLRGVFPLQFGLPDISAPETARGAQRVKIEGKEFDAREVFVYCDPPYLLSTRSYQRNLYNVEMKTPEEHAELLTLLRSLPCLVMLSGYASELYDTMLGDWRRVEFQAFTHYGKPRTEVLWMNYAEPTRLHDSRYWGKNYRERQSFTKVKKRMVARVAKMPVAKRWALLETLESALGISAPETALNPGTLVHSAGNGAHRCVSVPGKVSELDSPSSGRSQKVVLSTFSGAGLLDRGFRECGFCVVSAGDILYGSPIEEFRCVPGVFAGIIGGSPCQDWSDMRRTPPSGVGLQLMREFARVVTEGGPEWFLLENVRKVPDITPFVPKCYTVQRIYIRADECGGNSRRLRCVQFGYKSGGPLVIQRSSARHVGSLLPAALATDGRRKGRATWEDFCERQGLPRDFDLPSFTKSAAYAAVGNGVHLNVARALARSIAGRPLTSSARVCVCGCGREVNGRKTLATVTCRKRVSDKRKRESAGNGEPEPLTLPPTPEQSLEILRM
jgi:DNA (cytosine-5)-methyltransferase 1